MEKENDFSFGDDFEDQADDYEDLRGFVLNAPKRSSMHRNGKPRIKEFISLAEQGKRRKINRKCIRYDFGCWEG